MNNPQMNPPFDFDVSRWPALPPARGLFVTGTDTGVGKTLIAGAIARSLRREGKPVDVFKPAATGCRLDGGRLISADAEFLAACAGSSRTPSEICPLRYRSPVAPNVAAEIERRPVDLSLIFDAYGRMARENGDWLRFQSAEDAACPRCSDNGDCPPSENGDRHRFLNSENGASPHFRGPHCHSPLVVVEGIGGLLCPISDDFWVIHLAKMMALPLVVVARAGLGTINHTLLTLHAARSAGLAVAGVVVNRHVQDARPAHDDDSDASISSNSRQIEARGRVKVLAVVPEDAESSVEGGRVGPAVQSAIDLVDWESLAASARAR